MGLSKMKKVITMPVYGYDIKGKKVVIDFVNFLIKEDE